MTENTSRAIGTRLGGHVRRNIAGYLALALALSLTPAMASHLNVKASDIAKNAVTTPKIKNKAVTGKKMANLEGRTNVRQAQFSNGGQGDCIWQGANTLNPSLGRPHYYKDHLGIVHLGGIAIASDGAGGDGTCALATETEDGIVFRLPQAYRPLSTELHGVSGDITMIVVGKTALDAGTIVLPAGTVFSSSSFDPPQAALDGITFRASTTGGVSSLEAPTLDRAGRELLRRLLNHDQ
jgi:hypothetical protein